MNSAVPVPQMDKIQHVTAQSLSCLVAIQFHGNSGGYQNVSGEVVCILEDAHGLGPCLSGKAGVFHNLYFIESCGGLFLPAPALSKFPLQTKSAFSLPDPYPEYELSNVFPYILPDFPHKTEKASMQE